MAEGVAAGLRVDAQPMRASADRDAGEQPAAGGVDRVHLGVVAADSHNTLPSAETPPMSGLPPPGSRQVRATLLKVSGSITSTLELSELGT